MNIKEAKEQIKNAITAYFTKDSMGDYVIPIEKQRPLFLMGPPGIGKTAIVEQVAAEAGVGLLSYSMTHHTRQSAIGLPVIEHRKYKDMECDISQYTMSEIIASIYDMMERTGVEEGILFLDEINCVSETLAPIMLQFLQYKIFGKHRVPDGWIIVTAGNPPEYNNSVREFDIVTWDRLKRIDIEPDYGIWKEYAYQKGVHPAVLTYLDIKKSDFYLIESTVEGKSFVTARGWDDLSQMIQLYELNGLEVNEKLVSQYLQNPKIAKEFAIYYDLYQKYKGDYQIDRILSGKAGEDIKNKAKDARFDERLSVIGMMLDAIGAEIRDTMDMYQVLKSLTGCLRDLNIQFHSSPSGTPRKYMSDMIDGKRLRLQQGKQSGSLPRDVQSQMKSLIAILGEEEREIAGTGDFDEAFKILNGDHGKRVKKQQKDAAEVKKHMSNMFAFCEEVFHEGQEMLIIVTELTIDPKITDFINRYGCDEYFKHNRNLLVYDRRQEIEKEIDALALI